jgi:glycosyltransferase involved in cell wall biosynthesis
MTAYQTEAYLRETLQSVTAQSEDSWELVVVDNGNSDTIADIVREFLDDSRVRLLRQENKGYTGGISAAADVAVGDYLSVLDSDDLLEPQFVATMVDFLERHPEADAVGCDAFLFDDGEQHPHGRGYLHSTGTAPPPRDGERLTVESVLGGKVPYYTGAVRREAWDAVGGYQPGVADVDESVLIWLRLADGFDARLIPDKLARYRVRDGSLSRDPEKVERFESQLIRTFEMFGEQSGDPRHLEALQSPVRRLRYHQALRRARWAFMDGDTRGARRSAREAYGYQHSVRAAIVVVALTMPAAVLKAVYPLKQWLGTVTRRARLSALRQS